MTRIKEEKQIEEDIKPIEAEEIKTVSDFSRLVESKIRSK